MDGLMCTSSHADRPLYFVYSVFKLNYLPYPYVLHILYSTGSPGQIIPVETGAGLVQYLLLCNVPAPQTASQLLHEPQLVQPPFT